MRVFTAHSFNVELVTDHTAHVEMKTDVGRVTPTLGLERKLSKQSIRDTRSMSGKLLQLSMAKDVEEDS